MKTHQLLMVGAGALLGYLVYQGIKDGAGAVVAAVNPTDPDNLANKASNGFISFVSRGEYRSLGDYVYARLHPNENFQVTHTPEH